MNGCPANTYDIDGNGLTGQCGCEYSCTPTGAADPIDDQYKDDNCDGADGVVEACVYVSASQGSDVNNGTRTDPMQTISGAIQRAQMIGVPAVCLSGEMYNEAVNVVSGISVYGGFDQNDADFKFRRSANVTTTVKATGTVFHAAKIDQDTHIEGLTIEASTPMGNGESTYGVRLGGGVGTLFVRYNKMTIGNGTNGVKGTDGMAQAQSTAPNGITGQPGAENNSGAGKGGAAPTCDAPGGKGGDGGYNTTAGVDGSPGFGGTSGGNGANANGCTPVVNQPGVQGGPGQDGQASNQGTPGQGGNTLGSAMASFYLPANGGNGANAQIGRGGGGGGGGGGGSNAFPCSPDAGGGGGSGGCGGKGGNAGTGGQGGGGSFGVFAAAGKIVMLSNSIQLGNGGNGGIGGDGAQGQSGGIGGNGGSHSDDSGPGGKGGKGGKGGAGGPGGGGGGGPSACLARTSNVIFTFDPAIGSCNTGAVGIGANGGTNPDGGVGSKGNNGTSGFNIQMN